MKNWLSIIGLFLLSNSFAQQLDVGITAGYWFDNIVDSNTTEKRAVIGKGLWNPNFGVSALYYFHKPDEIITTRLGLLYRMSKKGSMSEVYDNNKFEFNSKLSNEAVMFISFVIILFFIYI